MPNKTNVTGAGESSLNWGGMERAERLGDRLFDRLFSLIDSGEFPLGSQLPPENEMATRFNVSRPLIREALSRLREKGVVVSKKGVGSFVSGPSVLDHGEKSAEKNVSAGFLPIGSMKDVEKCYEFRIALEGEAAFHAARNRSEEGLRELRADLDRIEAVISGGQIGTDVDYNFHLTVARCSDNSFFLNAMSMMHEPIRFSINLSRSLSLRRPIERLRTVQAEHIEIVERITVRDDVGARQAMCAHLSNAWSRISDGTS
jgi:GntR family transcriptional repressor for pyruvate dehydrogenase complex